MKMKKLDNKRLKEILKRINTDPNTEEQYGSKLNRILAFLNNNTGLKYAKIKPSGSQAKQTDTRNSDFDIIFCTSPDKDHKTIIKHIRDKAKEAFGKTATVKLGKKAVHIDFHSPRCNFDLVYVTQKKFELENKKIEKIRKIRPLHKNAIKLAKFAIERAKIKDIKGYEVEAACLNFNYNNLAECTFHLIKHFSGRIQQNGRKIDDILKFLR